MHSVMLSAVAGALSSRNTPLPGKKLLTPSASWYTASSRLLKLV